MSTTMQPPASPTSSVASRSATLASSANLLPTYILNSTSPSLDITSSTAPKPLSQKIASVFRSSRRNAREEQRRQRDEDDKFAHEKRRAVRLGMERAKDTGVPQLVGWDGDQDKDKEDAVEIYVLPPESEAVEGQGVGKASEGNRKKRFVKYETYLKLVGGGNQGEYNRAIGVAGMGMAIGGV